MKYGQQLEHESVPEWKLHNLDYNSLKHEIKRHTRRDAAAAAAMAIPGHPDVVLCRFEDGLYRELDRQHSRLDLFVSSKADEVARRLEHLDENLQRCIRRAIVADGECGSLKRQRRLARYERELLRCGQDILALTRFASAQVVAFRKILKKYRKWTGSTSLASRFSQSVLANPKSFTKRDFAPLQRRHDELLADLVAATADFSEPSSPSTTMEARSPPRPRAPAAVDAGQATPYWNEYDDGSDGDYAIYVDPERAAPFPGLASVRRRASELEAARTPLLCSSAAPARRGQYDTLDDGYASAESQAAKPAPARRLAAEAQPEASKPGQAVMLRRATAACFLASFVLLAIAGLLVATGRRKLRVEVDAGATAGVMASLACACSGLGMTLCRRDALRLAWCLLVWAAFVAACLCNGMLLVLVLASGP